MKKLFIAFVGVGMLAGGAAWADFECGRIGHNRYICEGDPVDFQGPQGPAGPAGPQGDVGPQGKMGAPGEVSKKVLHPIYEQADNNTAAIAASRKAIAENASNIANNRKGVAASLSVAAMQHNPNYEGLQTSFGLGYWDGQVGYGALVGQRLSEKIYGNVGIVGSGNEVGAVMSVTVQW